jgi:hypothetical protein
MLVGDLQPGVLRVHALVLNVAVGEGADDDQHLPARTNRSVPPKLSWFQRQYELHKRVRYHDQRTSYSVHGTRARCVYGWLR